MLTSVLCMIECADATGTADGREHPAAAFGIRARKAPRELALSALCLTAGGTPRTGTCFLPVFSGGTAVELGAVSDRMPEPFDHLGLWTRACFISDSKKTKRTQFSFLEERSDFLERPKSSGRENDGLGGPPVFHLFFTRNLLAKIAAPLRGPAALSKIRVVGWAKSLLWHQICQMPGVILPTRTTLPSSFRHLVRGHPRGQRRARPCVRKRSNIRRYPRAK